MAAYDANTVRLAAFLRNGVFRNSYRSTHPARSRSISTRLTPPASIFRCFARYCSRPSSPTLLAKLTKLDRRNDTMPRRRIHDLYGVQRLWVRFAVAPINGSATVGRCYGDPIRPALADRSITRTSGAKRERLIAPVTQSLSTATYSSILARRPDGSCGCK